MYPMVESKYTQWWSQYVPNGGVKMYRMVESKCTQWWSQYTLNLSEYFVKIVL